MRFYKYIYSLIFFGASFGVNAQIQCALDISINEGASVTMCSNALTTVSGASGFVAYNWSGPETLTGQTITPQFSGTYTLSATDGVACVSTTSILVTINAAPTPIIISSEGAVICPSVGTTLSTSTSYSSYVWSNGDTSPTSFVTTTNTYSVTVTDANSCSGQSNILISTFPFSLTSSAVSGCTSTAIALTATGGTSYSWSTGEFGNTIVVNPSSTTNYSVDITAGTCVETMSLTVQPLELLDFELADTIYVKAGENVFIPGPDGFSAYSWSPTNQIDSPFSQGVNFSGTESQILTINATHPTGCVLSDSVVMIVVDLSVPNGFSPNGDSYNEFFVIPELERDSLTAEITIWNRWGELVLQQQNYQNDWRGECRTDLCLGKGDLPEGTYFYHIDVHGITFRGYVTLKR
ncbi:MAG: gliding motility-associated C-terminal domain-containing protein [Fluviicola sp.]|nr:gliding motility-associated C-terminal domain-containing protein [Fluviicola sp.]